MTPEPGLRGPVEGWEAGVGLGAGRESDRGRGRVQRGEEVRSRGVRGGGRWLRGGGEMGVVRGGE